VLCYPTHATHIYQGLDVTVFGALKKYWSEEWDRYKRETGEEVSKHNFLAIYGAAHIQALMPTIIQSAFRKTGIWPYNRDVVTASMMAPSHETSHQGNLPLTPTTPVRVVAQAFHSLRDQDLPSSHVPEGLPSPCTDHEPFSVPTALHAAFG